MKIVIYNHTDQYALSRKQIDIIKQILPNEYFVPIKKFNILDDHRNTEVFEYFREERIVCFSYLIKQKTPEIVKHAVEELLIGLARIKAKSEFYHPLKDRERQEYKPFVDNWLPQCIDAISNKKIQHEN